MLSDKLGSASVVASVPVEKPAPKKSDIKLAEFLINFWDYDKSEALQRSFAKGKKLSRMHTDAMKGLAKNHWLPYFGPDKLVEDLEQDELDDFFFYLYTVKKLSGYTLEDKNYNELHTVKDYMVFTDHENISEMINIIDMTTKFRVPNCVIDGQRILFIDPKLEGHVVFLNYNAYFIEETLSADLKEVIVKLFLLKKKDFIKQVNHDDETEFELPQDIQSVINLYRRKCL